MKLNNKIIKLPKIIGHRGLKDIAPENTIASIKKAISLNFKWIEVDVKISKDNIPFLLHDNTLNRTTNGFGFPYKKKYIEISKLNASHWGKKKTKFSPPKLLDIIKICSKKKIGLNIELKPNKYKEKENVEAIVNLFKKNKIDFPYFFSSFDYKSIKYLNKIFPKARLSYLIDNLNKKMLKKILIKCQNINCYIIGLNIEMINKEVVNFFKKNNFIITVYSSKNIEYNKAIKLWKLGIDSLFIDNHLEYKKILKK